ncbi:MAG TPA: tetratricopeptide repeat protein [Opitutaceae bacterium]|nr:tetratricopeptide repeat protein [Opitutaceae bacterium]
MRLSPALPLRRLGLALVLSLLAAAGAKADLVWTPGTGWRIEGGALAGLTGEQGPQALALMNRARNDEEKGSTHAAISLYEKVAKKYSTSIYAPEAYYRVARLRLARKQYYKAFEALQNVIARYPSEKRFDEMIGEQYKIASLLLDGARNHVWGWLPLFRSRERGIGYCEIVVSNAPYSDYAPLALMSAARGYERLHDTEEAIDALDRMVNGYQQSVLVPFAYLELGRMHASLVEGAYYDQGETREAITYYEDFMILFPGDANIAAAARGLDKMKGILADSKMKIGDFYFYKRDNYTAARVFYNEAITAYPDSDTAKRAKQRLAAVEAKATGTVVPGAKKKHFLFF